MADHDGHSRPHHLAAWLEEDPALSWDAAMSEIVADEIDDEGDAE